MPHTTDHRRLMDSIYRHQRHIYDLTREYFLLGRKGLLRKMVPELADNGRVLEIGCGTAWNLVRLARMRPDVTLFGLDASTEMLETAETKVRKLGLSDRIVLRAGLAEDLDHCTLFELDAPFDAAFFSYSLTMIPAWKEAVACALANVKPGGRIYVVDFWDQAALPGWFRSLLQWWLALFHVRFDPALLRHLYDLNARGDIRNLTVTPVLRRYAYHCVFEKPE